MYLWSALISGCGLAVAFIDGRLLIAAIVAGAVLLATVLPLLIRDRSPRGSDRAPEDEPTSPSPAPEFAGAGENPPNRAR
jgi:hypothetical protein